MKDEIQRAEMIQGRIDGAKGRLKRLEDARPHLQLADAYDAYEQSPERPDTASAGRLELIKARFGFFVSFMADNYPAITELRQVTRQHAQEFTKSKYFAGKSASTYNAIISICNLIWKTLSDDPDAAIVENPWRKIRRKHEEPVRRRALTADELFRVCNAVEGEMRLLFSIGLHTGLRLGDCATLKWQNVDMMRRLIFATPKKTRRKTGQRVMIPIHRELLNMLLEIPEPKRRGYVMPKVAEEYNTSTMNLINAIRAVFEGCGIETQAKNPNGGRTACIVGFHSLRHSAVSIMANAGVPMPVVQSIVGHSRVEMTRHYFHESEDALISAVAAIPCFMSKDARDGADASAGVMGRFYAMADKMTAGERRNALEYLKGLDAGDVVETVEVVASTARDADAPAALPPPEKGGL